MLWREMQWPRDLFGVWSGLQQLHRVLDPSADSDPGSAPDFPAMNLYNGDSAATLVMEVPGVTAADLEVAVAGDALTVKGVRREEPMAEGASVLRRERAAGEFARTVQLPFRADPDTVSATLAHGVLTVTVAKHRSEMRRKIDVTTG